MNPQEPQSPVVDPNANQVPVSPPEPQPQAPLVQDFNVVQQPPSESPTPQIQPIQMPPNEVVQPPVDNMPPVATSTPSPVQPEKKSGADKLGIISVVLTFLGALPISLILGLVGASKAKKAGRSPVVSRIGWILSLVFMLAAIPIAAWLYMTSYNNEQAKLRDADRVKDINIISTRLEEYFEENFGYPSNLDSFVESDGHALVDPSGVTIKVNGVVEDEAMAKVATDPTSTAQYSYTPYGKPNCTVTCDGYVLKTYIETSGVGYSNPYVITGLENL